MTAAFEYDLDLSTMSVMERIALLPQDERDAIISEMTEVELADARMWLRPSQLSVLDDPAPIIVAASGRGWGKSRVGSSWVNAKAKRPGTRIHLVGRTVADVRDVMVQGPSGVLETAEPGFVPEYLPSVRRLVWPNGSVGMTFCLSDDVMAFTPDGWKTQDQLADGDLLYTLNTETGRGEWQPALTINRFHVDEEVSVIGEDGHGYISCRATDNHRWFVSHRQGELQWKTTTTLGPKMSVPTAAVSADVPETALYSDGIAELMGWFLAEGHVTSSRTVIIAQHRSVNDVHWKRIYSLLEKMFGAPSQTLDAPGRWSEPRWRCTDTHFHLNRVASYELLEHAVDGRTKRASSDFIRSLTRSQLQLLVDAVVAGDGATRRRGDSWVVSQHERHLIHNLELALTLLGEPHTVSETSVKYRGEPYKVWHVTRLSDSHRRPMRSIKVDRRERYVGVVWCPTTSNGTWLARSVNGRQAFFTGNSSEAPDQLRGPQSDYTWADELAAFKNKVDSSGANAWDNIRISTRLGLRPQILATTTPRRVRTIRELFKLAKETPDRVSLHLGSTFENRANLSPEYIENLQAMFEGTALAQQELYGALLDEVAGAMWRDSDFVYAKPDVSLGDLVTVIGVDPGVTTGGDATGIVVCRGTMERMLSDRRGWVARDETEEGLSPERWAARIVQVWREESDLCGKPAIGVAEKNQGGELVSTVIGQTEGGSAVPVALVHARGSKAARAEPILLAYRRDRIRHETPLDALEAEATEWEPGVPGGWSPNRLDAMVHAMRAIMVDDSVLQRFGMIQVAQVEDVPVELGRHQVHKGDTRAKSSMSASFRSGRERV